MKNIHMIRSYGKLSRKQTHKKKTLYKQKNKRWKIPNQMKLFFSLQKKNVLQWWNNLQIKVLKFCIMSTQKVSKHFLIVNSHHDIPKCPCIDMYVFSPFRRMHDNLRQTMWDLVKLNILVKKDIKKCDNQLTILFPLQIWNTVVFILFISLYASSQSYKKN